MKLRNLLYATMIACAFASCSNDDDPTPNPDPTPEAAEATLEVQIKTPLSSKATTMPNEDDKINSLQLIVFDPTTENVAYVGTTAGKAGENIAVKTTVKAGSQKVLVLANSTKTIAVGTSMDNVINESKTFDSENSTNGFSMNSGVFTVNIEAGKTNYVGYANSGEVAEEVTAKTAVILTTDPVKLFRNVGKVILKTVEISKSIDKNRYPNAALTLKNVYLLHAHKTTKLATEAAWGAINVTGSYLNGATDENYGKWTAYMADKKEIYPYMKSDYAEEGAYVQSLGNVTSISNGDKTFYAYENTEAEKGFRTLLVVEADFSYTTENGGTTTSAGRFYPIAVGYTGSDFGNIGDDFNGLRSGNLSGLLRNLKYEVALGVKGPGYTTPFGPKGDEDTFLDVQVKVVDFGFVSQSEEIE